LGTAIKNLRKQRAVPRASARRTRIIPRTTRANFNLFPLHISRAVLLLPRQLRGRGSDLGTTITYLRKTTSGTAGIGLGTTVK
jgi:hypothetical protein